LGFTGISGNGQSELAEVVTGMRKAIGGKSKIIKMARKNFSIQSLRWG
jgi:ABC-type uncharacterized transport system ATPase subunit